MQDDEIGRKYFKHVRPEMYNVLKQNYGIVKMFYVSGINVNKATIVVYDTVAPTTVIGDESKLSIQSIKRLGDKMVLPVNSDCIDSVISLHGDVAACIFVKEGTIIGMLSFEEMDMGMPDKLDDFIKFMIKKK